MRVIGLSGLTTAHNVFLVKSTLVNGPCRTMYLSDMGDLSMSVHASINLDWLKSGLHEAFIWPPIGFLVKETSSKDKRHGSLL